MKIQLQINVPLDDKKKLERAGRDFEALLSDLGAAENALEGRDEADYHVNLSAEALSPKKLFAAFIRSANDDQARGEAQLTPSKPPPSMTALLEKPQEDFDTFINKIAASGKKLLDAHNPIDPQVAIEILS